MTDEEDDSEEASKLRELIAYLESIAQWLLFWSFWFKILGLVRHW
jgi:hypothetical protein